MTKLVVLNLGKGNLQQGFATVTAQLYNYSNPIPIQFTGSLPAAPELIELYKRWQLLYLLLHEALFPGQRWQRNMANDTGIEIDTEDITNISSVEFSNLCNKLQNKINIWLKSDLFRNIDQKLRTKLDPYEEIRVILETEDNQVRRLPWHLWDFFEDYQKAVFGLSAPEVDEVKPLHKSPRDKVRILAILGNSEGIDIQQDRAILEQLPGTQTVFLVEPQRLELDRWLWDKQGWDILFFAGHGSSQADYETGEIYINQTESLTIAQLKNGLKAAIARGLQLAIFNCCDGLGLVRELASLYIPQMIVMREVVPDQVAQEFLKHFLEAFANGESCHLAMREATERLQGLESSFPCASWLPVICQNPTAMSLVLNKVGSRTISLHARRNIIRTIFQVSIITTTLIMGMRSFGMLQSWELTAFDAMMRSRPDEGQDKRILIVTVTEADVRSQPANQRGGASLSDRALAQVVEKLEQFQPRVIGLDIYRENSVGAEYPKLSQLMQKSDRFFAICKVSEENKNSGVSPPPEVPKQNLGFSDVIPDPDGIVRRQILAMAPASPCNVDKSFSFQLANRYLFTEGIEPKLTAEKNWQFNNVIFKNLEENSGGYHGIDSLGHQVLLNYRSSHQVATQVTLKDVLNNKLTSDLVKNRIVLIGTTAESFHDYWSTPYSAGQWPYEQMPGVMLQAHMISQILSAVLDHRPLLWMLPKWGEFIWVWAWSLVGSIIVWQFRSWLRLGLAGVTTVCVLYGVSFGLLLQGAWIPLLPSILVLIVCGASVKIYTLFPSDK
ncbi:CHASE2 domain-containing protein [Nostoc sp. ChiVER01]|uniref:CHASE2 domain-containing protein n=1 Tax=Nostoc sp. ChiVER01 TaxID=3075382 RepID=UPI002AD50533|nr:CHASE2 domain-containing protein [Nostoc sp. ChiVER01]MDZ8224087.1 CHASE2 domain-containing protein [Nostoc sp. ChiVER01]